MEYVPQPDALLAGLPLQGKETGSNCIREGMHFINLTVARLTLRFKMSEEQMRQLYELMHAARDIWKPIAPTEQK